MILVINICKEKLHYYEFVKPIEEILKQNGAAFKTIHYKNLNEKILANSEKIIICGTSLFDDYFISDVNNFLWIKRIKKPILGICGGMQIIQLVYGSKIKKKSEIGFFKENFKKDFLGLYGEIEVYHLHNNYCSLSSDFLEFCFSEIPQAIKHKKKEIYGVLFHPEVRNKDLIDSFVKFIQKI